MKAAVAALVVAEPAALAGLAHLHWQSLLLHGGGVELALRRVPHLMQNCQLRCCGQMSSSLLSAPAHHDMT